ncbi:flagellar transcriptional regulator FlhD [Alcaligenaceae bacterium SJ-26]|nr:flagellar transcriptional regulator FlhD [Alcaligenaceae bacterium SJ-26]
MNKVQSGTLLDNIKEINLSYLMLAQRMLRDDYPAALFRLGLGREAADALLSLSPAQLVKLGSSSMLLCRLRLDNPNLLATLNDSAPRAELQQVHAAILLSSQSVEQFA